MLGWLVCLVEGWEGAQMDGEWEGTVHETVIMGLLVAVVAAASWHLAISGAGGKSCARLYFTLALCSDCCCLSNRLSDVVCHCICQAVRHRWPASSARRLYTYSDAMHVHSIGTVWVHLIGTVWVVPWLDLK